MVVICNTPYPKSNEIMYENHFHMFPYELSDFQKYSIEAIVNGHHVLTTAHTGSGKTLSAEFAIQYFTAMGKKVIYTSPIKALSNQKFYEFSQKYPHISFGLCTGDIKMNPNADCIIMTAEILMNYLFAGNIETDRSINNATTSNRDNLLQFNIDIHKELGCVIMDEIHFINDQDRGQVWEKTILMLPKHIQMIMLSATIDAPEQFAKWCERGHENKQVYLASTNYRIVPLKHFSFITTTEAIFKKVKDKAIQQQIRNNTNTLLPLQTEGGKFIEQSYLQMNNVKKILQDNNVFMKRSHVLNSLCIYLKNNDMLPAIAFVFSRKHVELFATEITVPLLEDDSKIPYIVKKECDQIIRKLPNFKEYLELPEYNHLISLLEKGIGIHHSGMIPILREIVELMISKKYIKLLFATESFAVGLSCPIRTAIFTSLTKFDGNTERYLYSHEYTQSAGRAGRRGIDDIGYVIHCNNLFNAPTQTEYKEILCGKPQNLQSKFQISNALILTLIDEKIKQQCHVDENEHNGNNMIDFFNEFVCKSMLHNEITKQSKAQQEYIIELEMNYVKMQKSNQFLRTPQNICNEYIQAKETAEKSVNKKRKEAERVVARLEDEYKFLKEDVVAVKKQLDMELLIKREQTILKNMENFIVEKIKTICNFLEKENFIHQKNDFFELTEKGNIAINIAEIDPIIFTNFFIISDYFASFSLQQIIGFLSCFTNIKINSQHHFSVPTTKDPFLKYNLDKFYQIVQSMEKEEEIIFDIVDDVIKWCDCQTEEECKYFIYSVLKEKEISIGDFTKAILKISTIIKEMMIICEKCVCMDLMAKLSHADAMLLKYIATNQSIYV